MNFLYSQYSNLRLHLRKKILTISTNHYLHIYTTFLIRGCKIVENWNRTSRCINLWLGGLANGVQAPLDMAHHGPHKATHPKLSGLHIPSFIISRQLWRWSNSPQLTHIQFSEVEILRLSHALSKNHQNGFLILNIKGH